MINVAQKRKKTKLKTKFAELGYWRDVEFDTNDLFVAYDYELNVVIDKLLNLKKEKLSELQSDEEKSTEVANLEESKNSNQHNFEWSGSEKNNRAEKPSSATNLSKLPAWMKKAFKAIALKTHPDKVMHRSDISEKEKENLIALYRSAVSAVENKNGIELVEVAKSLEIDVELDYKTQVAMLDNKIFKIKEEILGYHATVSWAWGENEGKIDLRTNLIIHVLNQLQVTDINRDVIEDFIKKFEEDDLENFEKDKKLNRIRRKVGERPAPPISKLRRE